MDSIWNVQYFENTLSEMFERMKDIGRDPQGGYTRFMYTQEWLKGMNEIKSMMESAGLKTNFSNVGNLFGKLEAKTQGVNTIMAGSHADTVRNGGLYDGLFGILAALTAAKFLKENFGQPAKNIEVVAFSEEEGARFPFSYWGSRNMVEDITEERMKDTVDANGLSITSEMRKYGFDYKPKGAKARSDIDKFLEIHIEQGGVLEYEKKSVGIVDAIVGMRRFFVEIEGEANHAGTTPMTMRKDAMDTASHIISRLIDTAGAYGPPLVLTVGNIASYPGLTNVVPGKVVFSIDTRTPDGEFIKSFHKEIESIVYEEAAKRNTSAKLNLWTEEVPTPLNKDMIKLFEDICLESSIPYMHLHSGAGHDSQVLAQKYDTAMLFVPSEGGISHSPKEFTQLNDLALGAFVLAKAMYKLAY